MVFRKLCYLYCQVTFDFMDKCCIDSKLPNEIYRRRRMDLLRQRSGWRSEQSNFCRLRLGRLFAGHERSKK
jgi:hypothetical protein